MRDKRLLAAVLVGGLLIFARAGVSVQAPEDVLEAKLYLSKTKLATGDVLKLALSAELRKTWHIHAAKLEDEFLVPTVLTIEDQPGLEVLEVVYPKSKRVKYDYSETALDVFEGEALVGALLRVAPENAPGPRRVKVKFRYQACDDRSCLPPKTLEWKVDFEIVAAGGQAVEDYPEVFKRIVFAKLK
jgi:hypothetical protein